jgi:hypothetical protein
VAIAGRRWHLPINGPKNSNAAGQADRSNWDHRNWVDSTIGSYFAAGFGGCKVTDFTTE